MDGDLSRFSSDQADLAQAVRVLAPTCFSLPPLVGRAALLVLGTPQIIQLNEHLDVQKCFWALQSLGALLAGLGQKLSLSLL